MFTSAWFLLSCWQRNCRQVTSSDRASRAMMASLTETLCCLTHIPACNAVGVVSPSLLELQLLPARQNLGFTFVLLASVLRPQKFFDHKTQIKNEDIPDNQDTTGALLCVHTSSTMKRVWFLCHLCCWLWCELPEAEGSRGSPWWAAGCQPGLIFLLQLPTSVAWNRPQWRWSHQPPWS